MRESTVEDLLHARIELLGGLWRRVRWIGRKDAPDDFIALPSYYWTDAIGTRRLHGGFRGFVECKRPSKDATASQAREHERLRAVGVRVLVINTPELIDQHFPKDGCK